MQSQHRIVAPGNAEVGADRGTGGTNKIGQQGIDHDVADKANPALGNAFSAQIGIRIGGRRQQQVGNLIGQHAIDLFGHRAIPAAESDGLIATGSKQPRTFGEAQIDLRLLFQADKCASFGSAMLKSRSSDSFTSQLKDFVAPVPIDLQNCANVIIRKQTQPQLGSNSPDFRTITSSSLSS